jgi:Ca2+-binding RTX toxin-like protein
MYFAVNNGTNSDLYILESGNIPVTNTPVSISLIGTVFGTLPDDTPDNPDDNPVGAASIDSLAFDNYGNLWGADNDGTLIKIDPETATIQGGTTLANNEVTGSGVYSLGIAITEDQTFTGNSGDDIITGGSGSDILTGNGGNDLFVWTSSDDLDVDGTPADGVALDVVTDFRDDGLGDLDALDLSDLLIGEESGDITDYIEVQVDGDDIVLSVTTDPSNNPDVTQTIVLEDTTTTQLGINTFDLGTAQGQVDALNTLIANGSIQVDS